ncbi:tetratricopeptide repeat protein [Cytophagaceae bacterium DM2B3-1]|uniref:Tetratricopeptide repeat protein n=1 Tax=Xanthocytophaga flava TaxID=3048013 RepID=A0AAE3QT77_9BACT|nr:tetratricopeptide repeat protein [Xanthocytophaga flavus]MDJ1484965.1 tetratricopeptide repeat protein [Xanthocytophaga flavus]MDJ1497469.1 tetratricopeptide repeat protein [Xanthocytophaga flavus]
MAKKTPEATVNEPVEQPIKETPELSLENAEDFVQRNRNLFLGGLAAVVLLVGGIFFYRYYTQNKETEAQKYMFRAVLYFEADSLTKALNGDGVNDGLLKIADEYGSTKAGKLAHFYAGVALLKQGKYDDAITHLKDFSSSDLLLQARAYSLVGDAYLEKKQPEEAVSYYEKAANYEPNKFFTPAYLLKLGIAYEMAKQNDKAIETYDKIITNYEDSAETITAKKYKSKLQGLAG